MNHDGRTFTGETIVLDFNSFNDCTFDGCTLAFHGYGPVGLVGCRFLNCQWAVDGPAGRTLQFLSSIYGMGDEGARDLVEATFRNIRGDQGDGPPGTMH